MPAREFLNPYAALTQPDVAMGGVANLAAAMVSAPQEQAEMAMRGRQIASRDLFERARLAQEDRRLGDEAQYRRDALAETTRDHNNELNWRKEIDTERSRHDRAMEARGQAGQPAQSGGLFGDGMLGSLAGGFGIPGLGGGAAPAGKPTASAKAPAHDPGLDASTVMQHAYAAAKAAHGENGDPAAIEQTANDLYDMYAATPGSNLPPRPKKRSTAPVLPPGGKPLGGDQTPWYSPSPDSWVRGAGDFLGNTLHLRMHGDDGQLQSAGAPVGAPGAGAPPAAAPAPAATRGTLRTSQMTANIGPGKPFADLPSAVADAQRRGYTIVQDQ